MDSAFTVSDRFAQRGPASRRAPGKPLATPAVRRLAREIGVDIKLVIRHRDAAGASPPATFAPRPGGRAGAPRRRRAHAVAGSGPAGIGRPGRADRRAAPVAISEDGVAQRIPFRGVRRKIAEALQPLGSDHRPLHRRGRGGRHRARQEAPGVRLPPRAQAQLAALRDGRRLQGPPQHPSLNANVDDENGEILIKNVINLGCAVDTDHGLMVPVIRNADNYGLVQLGDAVGDLAKQCRDRSVPREQMTGGTFTVSNVGSYGGMFATPIINYPEVSILAAGRAKREGDDEENGAFYAGLSMPLSISCDHRVVDGAEAGSVPQHRREAARGARDIAHARGPMTPAGAHSRASDGPTEGIDDDDLRLAIASGRLLSPRWRVHVRHDPADDVVHVDAAR
jgi:pyruvate dehydrogenase E2 component (dihydrolipoamide acetyltransferase)